MLRAVAHYENGLPIVMLGLDRPSLTRLQSGQALKVNLHYLHGRDPMASLPDIDVAIFLTDADRNEVLRQIGATSGGRTPESDDD